MKAIWEDTILAESEQTISIEGNHYFPPDAIKREHLAPSEKHTTCPWKGVASYYHVQVGNNPTRMPPGTIPIPRRPPDRSRTTLRFGAA